MATERIGEAVLKLSTDATDLFREFDRVKGESRGVDAEFESLRRRARGLGPELQKAVDQFEGRPLIDEARRVAQAIERVGGVSKLTDKELRGAADTVTAATAKLRRMGDDVPPSLRKLETELKTLGHTGTQTSTALTGVASITGPLARNVAGVFAAVQVGRAVANVIEFSGSLVDLEAKTQINVTALQSMKAATEDSGVALDTVAKASLQLTRRIAEGESSAVGALRQLNLEWAAIRQLAPEQQLFRVGDAIGRVTDQGTKLSLVNDLFGRTGQELLPALNGRLQETADAFARMGLVIDEQTVRAADKLGDEWTILKTQGGALLANVLAPMLPALSAIAGGISSVVGSGLVQWVLQTATVLPRLQEQLDKIADGLEVVGLKASTLPEVKGPAADALAGGGEDLSVRAAVERAYAAERLAIERQLTASAEALITKHQEEAEASKQVAAARSSLLGQDAIDRAQTYATALGDVANVTRMTAERKAELRAIVQAALQAYQALGQQAPARLREILAATQPLLTSTARMGSMLAPFAQTVADQGRAIRAIVAGQAEDGTVLVRTTADIAAANAEAARRTQEWVNRGGGLAPVLRDSAAAIREVRGEVGGLTQALQAGLMRSLQAVPQTIANAFVYGGSLKDAIKSLASQIGADLGKLAASALGFAGPWGQAIGAAIGSLLPAIGRLFGGPSQEVLRAREEVEAFQQSLAEGLTAAERAAAGNETWRMTITRVAAAYEATGRTAAEAEAIVRQLWDTDHPERARAAMEEITRVLEEQERQLERNRDTAADLFDDIMEAGRNGIPASMQPTIDRFIELGLLSEDQIAQLRALGAATGPTLDQLSEDAETLGAKLEDLGPRFAQAKLDEEALRVNDAINRLVRNGGDVGSTLMAAREELGSLVSRAREGGLTLSESLRPWIEDLLASGNLVDENGERITDLAGIEWGPPMRDEAEVAEEGWTRIQEAILELIALMRGDLQREIDRDRTVTVEVEYDDPGFDPRNPSPERGFNPPALDQASTDRRAALFGRTLAAPPGTRAAAGLSSAAVGDLAARLQASGASAGATTTLLGILMPQTLSGRQIGRQAARFLADHGLATDEAGVTTQFEKLVARYLLTYGGLHARRG